jgi:hypothetical protein
MWPITGRFPEKAHFWDSIIFHYIDAFLVTLLLLVFFLFLQSDSSNATQLRELEGNAPHQYLGMALEVVSDNHCVPTVFLHAQRQSAQPAQDEEALEGVADEPSLPL